MRVVVTETRTTVWAREVEMVWAGPKAATDTGFPRTRGKLWRRYDSESLNAVEAT
jgi:hypothetical protein